MIEPPISREVVLALTAAAKNTWREIKDETAKIDSVCSLGQIQSLWMT